MNEAHGSDHIGRSIRAVLAALIVGIVLTVATDAALHAANILPPLGQPTSDPLLLLAATYRTIYAVLSTYIGVRLAPSRPMAHADRLRSYQLVAEIAKELNAGVRLQASGVRS